MLVHWLDLCPCGWVEPLCHTYSFLCLHKLIGIGVSGIVYPSDAYMMIALKLLGESRVQLTVLDV